MAPANKTGVYARKLLEGCTSRPAGGCGCAENSIPDALFLRRSAPPPSPPSPTRFSSRADVKHHTPAIQVKQEAERELAGTKPERDKIRPGPRVWHDSLYCSICLSISSTHISSAIMPFSISLALISIRRALFGLRLYVSLVFRM